MAKFVWSVSFFDGQYHFFLMKVIGETKTLYKTEAGSRPKKDYPCVVVDDEEAFLHELHETRECCAKLHMACSRLDNRIKGLLNLEPELIEQYNFNLLSIHKFRLFLKEHTENPNAI